MSKISSSWRWLGMALAGSLPIVVVMACRTAKEPSAPAVETPPGLHDVELPPMHGLYEEALGVLYVDVPGEKVERLWHELYERHQKSGYYPVILGGSTASPVWKWLEDEPSTLQRGMHKATDPRTVLAQVDSVDTAALLAPGGNPSYQGWELEHGTWPAAPKRALLELHLDPLTKRPQPEVRVALVPVDAAWKSVAYLSLFLEAGEATPSLAQATAVCRLWEEQRSAKVMALGGATIEWYVEEPIQAREAALSFAEEHFTFTPEGGPRILEERAAWLLGARHWSAWWD